MLLDDDVGEEDLFDNMNEDLSMNEDELQKKESDGEGYSSKNESKTTGKKNTAHVSRNSRKATHLKLDAERLFGPRGIPALNVNFQHQKLKGKGHEKSDLDLILKNLEQWTHRLFPKLTFEDCVERVEKLGNNRSVQVYMKRFRADMLDPHPCDGLENDVTGSPPRTEKDAFDDLIEHYANPVEFQSFTKEQQLRMAKNKKLAEERRKSRAHFSSLLTTTTHDASDLELGILPSSLGVSDRTSAKCSSSELDGVEDNMDAVSDNVPHH